MRMLITSLFLLLLSHISVLLIIFLLLLNNLHFFSVKLVEIFENLRLLLFKFQHFSRTSVSSLCSLIFRLPSLLSMTLIFSYLNISSWLRLRQKRVHFYLWHLWLTIFRWWLHCIVIGINLDSVLGDEPILLAFGNIPQFTRQFVCLVSHWIYKNI